MDPQDQPDHDGSTFSPSELLSPDELRRRETTIWRRQAEYVMSRSDFYKRKFEDLDPMEVGSFENIAKLPFTEKGELRESLAAAPPLGLHQAAETDQMVQIQATSGTTGTPSLFGLTENDLRVWSEVGARGLFACGFRPGHRILHAMAMSRGFAGGAPSIRLFQRLGSCVVPLGAESGADRLLGVALALEIDGLITGPNFAAHLGDVAPHILGRAASELGVQRVVVGGEPGGGEPALRARIESLWGATCTETLGNSDIIPLMWAECLARDGMHWCAQEYVHVELIDPQSGDPLPMTTGAVGELVYTALQRESAPLVRFRSRDHVEVISSDPCQCGRSSPRIRCFGRTDDMLIVRGVNVWPSAVRDVVATFHPRTTGAMRIQVDFEGHVTDRHLQLRVESSVEDAKQLEVLRSEIRDRLLSVLVVRADVEMVRPGTIEPAGSGKTALVERTGIQQAHRK